MCNLGVAEELGYSRSIAGDGSRLGREMKYRLPKLFGRSASWGGRVGGGDRRDERGETPHQIGDLMG